MSTLRVTTVTNPSGGQPTIDGLARAWVNFNGTGTVAIRASLNVSSITDNGTGDYTVNFTTAMPDVNYGFCWSFQNIAGAQTTGYQSSATSPSTTAIRVTTVNSNNGAVGDTPIACVTIFR